MSNNIVLSVNGSAVEIMPPKRFIYESVRSAATELKSIPDEADKILIDMRLTEYMDSSALGYLLMVVDKTPKASRKIINAKSNIRKVIEISRINSFFDIP